MATNKKNTPIAIKKGTDGRERLTGPVGSQSTVLATPQASKANINDVKIESSQMQSKNTTTTAEYKDKIIFDLFVGNHEFPNKDDIIVSAQEYLEIKHKMEESRDDVFSELLSILGLEDNGWKTLDDLLASLNNSSSQTRKGC